MGCASSSPIMDSGKTFVDGAKETVSDTMSKGGKVLEGLPSIKIIHVGESAKEGLSHGMDTVKETMHNAVNTAEHGVDTVIGKIGETFAFASSTASEVKEDLETKKDELVTNASDTATEAVSEAETVLASETESAKDAFTSKMSPAFETMKSVGEDISEKAAEIHENGIELIDDLEESMDDMLGDNVSKLEKKMEEIMKTSPADSPVKEVVKEEPPPTFWEAAADAIILQKTIKSMGFRDMGADNRNFNQPDIYDTNDFIKESRKEVVTD
uniref:Uncharacterized protein LOC114329064 isoform X1 n=2 Tax=Diabrotica virgifera virgifera TaxID=50390 RepID=A0A6P7FLM0_DIAVI